MSLTKRLLISVFFCYRPASQVHPNAAASSKLESSAQSYDLHRALLPNQSGNQCKPSSATKSDIEQPAGNSEADSDETVKPATINPDSTEANAEMTMKQDALDQPSASDTDNLQGENKER